MSELKFKSYGELDISEALTDASHVVIEENGEVKRFPANSIGGGVSSWNDLTDKPFYTNRTKLFEGTVTAGQLSPSFVLTIGNTYLVIIDGEEYECVCHGVTQGTADIPLIGNADMWGDWNNSPHNNEPFAVTSSNTCWLDLYENYANKTVSLAIFGKDIKTIDEQFIPNTIVRTKDIPIHTWESLPDKPFYVYTVNDVAIENTEIAFTDNFGKCVFADYSWRDAGFEWVPYSEHIVEWDGVRYTLTPQRTNGDYGDWFIGSSDFSTAPFKIVAVRPDPPCDYEAYIYANDGASSHTVHVYAIVKNIKTLAEDVIPSTIARTSDIPETVTDEHINALIDAKLEVIENGTY